MFHTKAFWGMILLALGVLLLLGNFDIIYFSWHRFWHLFWPILLIVIGLYIIWNRMVGPEKSSFISINCDSGAMKQDGNRYTRTFGDIHVDAKDMEIDGLSVSVTFGDTHINLSGGKLKPEINTIGVSSTFGDITVVLPNNVEVSINAANTFGDITALGRTASGMSNRIVQKTDGYDAASTKLDIGATTTFGDIKIFRA
ncbi:hypothetical protein TRIP_C60311 [Candidatus Zixiibacteriota bacterium]|nr:hypothetical protein TRIP_C60311 [candidate division Zixibacteria bacterium]